MWLNISSLTGPAAKAEGTELVLPTRDDPA